MTVKKPLFRNLQGLIQQLQDGSIVNIGGTTWPGFTVDGIGVLLEDGTSTTGGSINLQTVYNNSIDLSGDASIKLLTGRDLVIYDDTNNAVYFKIDSETGKVTITGDLEVAGSSVIIDSVIQDSDHWRISPLSSITTSLKIEPEFNSPLVDLVQIKHILGGPIVFKIDKDGNTSLQQLSVSNDVNVTGDIVISGLVDGIDVSFLASTVNTLSANVLALSSAFTSHITLSPTLKHAATEISVTSPTYAPGTTNVQEVLDAIGPLLGGGGPSASAAGLFITDITPTSGGIVGNKQYVSGTIPSNVVISQATSDVDNVRIHILAEGNAAFYSPTVLIDTTPGPSVAATLSEHPTDKRLFTGYADISVTSSRTIYVTSSTGITTTVNIVKSGAGPVITSLIPGAYPGIQTAAKSGDIMSVSGIVENAATYVEIIAISASASMSVMSLGAANSGGAGYKTFSGTFTVSGLTGAQSLSARARNSLGTYGTTFISTPITLDQTYPTIGTFTITYPVGQSALKGTESATISSTVTNFDTINYSGTNLSIAAPTTYANNKTATRTGGSYIDSGTNYIITATRTSNGAVTSASTLVKIANVAPTAALTIAGNPIRLRSSVAGNAYIVNLVASQNLSSAPVLNAPSGILSSFTGSGKNWSATITINDSHPKGNHSFTITTMSNEALISGTTITSGQIYTVGGFLTHSIVFPAFARYAPIGTQVTELINTTAKYAGAGSNLTLYNNTGDYFQGYTIVDSGGSYDPNGTHLWISDAAYAGANTTGTLTLEIQEAA